MSKSNKDAKQPKVIIIRHGDNAKSILNADCRVVLLLDAIKDKCRTDRSTDVDLVDEDGKLRDLAENGNKYAYEVLQDRHTFIPLAIEKNGDDDGRKFTPLLNSATMQVDYPAIYANLESLSKNKIAKGRLGLRSKKVTNVTGRSSRQK